MSFASQKRFSKKPSFLPSPDTPAKILERKGYHFGRILGEGTYCQVRLARKEGQRLAVKIIKCYEKSQEYAEKFLPRELSILPTLNHKNIIKVYDIYNFTSQAYIFMELVERGDLLDFIRNRSRLNENEARQYFRQLVSAIQYLHSRNICHRDLKCENILITDDGQIKIIDFGFSKSCVGEAGKRTLSETYCGSTAYAAPEILLGTPYNPMMYDIWSLGCVLFIMVSGSMPFDDSDVKEMVKLQLRRKIKFVGVSSILSAQVKALIRHMLEPDLTKRATLEQILRDPWFRGPVESVCVLSHKLIPQSNNAD